MFARLLSASSTPLLLLTNAPVWLLINFILLVTQTAKCIDPEYSLENRVDHFMSATLNSVLSAMKMDQKPIDQEVTFWCMNR